MILALLAGACRRDMEDQARVDPFEESPLVSGEAASMLPPAGTVARGVLAEEKLNPGPAGTPGYETIPLAVTSELMQRGRERFAIFCVPCHGLTGRGDGPVIQRGFFPSIADLQQDRLRLAPVGYVFGVITDGFNAMPDYGPLVPPADRWAIIAYLRALQYSQHAQPEDAP
jgi:mono/diheme cytochrome c family protein